MIGYVATLHLAVRFELGACAEEALARREYLG